MLACRHSADPNLIPALLQMGADPGKRDRDARTAFDYLAVREKTFSSPAAYAALVEQRQRAVPK